MIIGIYIYEAYIDPNNKIFLTMNVVDSYCGQRVTTKDKNTLRKLQTRINVIKWWVYLTRIVDEPFYVGCHVFVRSIDRTEK